MPGATTRREGAGSRPTKGALMFGRKRPSLPSPAITVAVVALVAALAGTALAEPNASISAITKKKVKGIVAKQIDTLAPGLSVAHADTADKATNATSAQSATRAQTANTVGGIPPSQIGAVGRNNFVPGGTLCQDGDHNGTDCASVDLQLPRSGRVFVTATAEYFPINFNDLSGPDSEFDTTNSVKGFCQIAIDGIAVGGPAFGVVENDRDFSNLTVHRVTQPLDPGTYNFAIRCTEQDGEMAWELPSISAVMLGSA